MKFLKFLIGGAFATPLMMQAAGAAGPIDASVIEIVTFKLKPGVTAAEFKPIDKQVEMQHVVKQPGFVSRESVAGENNEWLVIVQWRSVQDAEASMATFERVPAAAAFMTKIDTSTLSMKRYQK